MTVMDVAGGPTGGAARFRREAERWVAAQEIALVRLVGAAERVEPRWLIRRELIDRSDRRIATNNMSFLSGRGTRIVLLRNALHFLRPGEAEGLSAIPTGIRSQIPLIRAAARRADVIVVPCTDMGERVTRILPKVAERLQVRHHPLTATSAGASRGSDDPYILYPSMPSAHKDLTGNLRQLAAAIARTRMPLRIKVTCQATDIGGCAELGHIDPIGAQSLAALDSLWERASAAFSPTTVESFGYPVAEGARLRNPRPRCRHIAEPRDRRHRAHGVPSR